MGHSLLGSQTGSMLLLVLTVCCFGYSNLGLGYSTRGYSGLAGIGYSGLGYSGLGYSSLGYSHYRYPGIGFYQKREADADPEAKAEPYYGYGYFSPGYSGFRYYGLGYSTLGYLG